ncbi:PLP-dependent aminotransferase family protein [Clostridium cylindrosporum]|uniref:Aromatic-amino-acid aminotransferase 1 n=1 Tax=Clostridium cylindrosporum DSM 605 TaxID=1121307 RepID=A0A0J8DAB0_CLOCY|nr:PLP-dependent aminotransferase family protein [Clostridium cylindrosporum]KMT21249.1 aromatic-amino-acid aminotransferase 1 [Clostridium cylindrosporum DSM 605]
MAFHEFIQLDKNSPEAMYIQIYNEIKKFIENGSLKPHEKLPAIRNLGSKLSVNNVTIVNAYKMLEQNGLVYSKVGSGTFVKGDDNLSNVEDKENIKKSLTGPKEGTVHENKSEINFATLTPDPVYFPVQEFKEAMNEVLDRDGGYAFAYQEAKGYYPLRESLRDYIINRKVNTDIEDIHIISGAQQGIDIVSKALINFNDTIVVESPTYTGALAAFRSRGANIIEVPIISGGMDLELLEEALKKYSPKLIYVMTSFQNPTGISYSDEKKQGLLFLAKKYNTYILEDDYLPELKFSGKETYPVKAIDTEDRVIYLKSFSKIFMPGIRLGFLAVPKSLTSNIMSAKHTSDISTSSLMQRTFDLYIRKKKWQGHIERMSKIYKNKYDITIKALREVTPFIEFDNPEGGIHIYCKSDMDSLMLGSIIKQRGASVVPGRVFYLDNREDTHFRLSFAAVEDDKIEEGIKIIRNAYMDLKNLNSGNLFPYL